MKLGWNLAASLTNSVWTAVIGLAAVPFYLRFLGVEAYGLVGFFAAMQAVFAVLDMGLGPTINREVARSTAGESRAATRDLLHTLGYLYWAMAFAIAAVTALAAPAIAGAWLNSTTLPQVTVERAVMLMGLIVGCRWPLGLYLGALTGAQRIVLASGVEMAMATLASVGAVLVLAFVSRTIEAFFLWQALVGLLNVVVIRICSWRALRDAPSDPLPRFDTAGLKRIWRFTAGMGMTALLGTVLMQSDKVLLSKIVTLEELGRYTLAGLAVRSLYLLLTPVFTSVFPRFSALHASGEEAQVEALYRSGTRLLMAAIFPLAAFVAVFSTEIFQLWTGDEALARSVDVTVDLLLLGTALNGAMHFPYALQLAYGRSNLPVIINLMLITVFAPLLVVLALRYGIAGGAAAWAVLNFLYLLVGAWLTHRTMLPGIGLRWIIGDVGLPFAVAAVVAGAGGLAVQTLGLDILSRLALGALLSGCAFLLVVALSPRLLTALREAAGHLTLPAPRRT